METEEHARDREVNIASETQNCRENLSFLRFFRVIEIILRDRSGESRCLIFARSELKLFSFSSVKPLDNFTSDLVVFNSSMDERLRLTRVGKSRLSTKTAGRQRVTTAISSTSRGTGGAGSSSSSATSEY